MNSVAIHTLGCKVNQCDAEALMAQLAQAGYTIHKFDQQADIYIINTCTVTHTGDKKSLQTIRRIRRQSPSAFVAVCGCMPRSQAEGVDRISDAGADFIFDTRKPEDLLVKLEEHFGKTYHPPPSIETLSERTRALIKIQDGCDRYCSYCIVPYVRGPVISRPPADILAEAKTYIKHGTQEIVLTGIQVAAYGHITDNGYITLPGLIKKLASLPKRLRLSSIDPWAIDEAFLSAISHSPTLCPHFHLSLQSGCNQTLARMNRRYTTTDYAKAAEKLKCLHPSTALTTDIIVGFPGETDTDFQESMHFAEKMSFARIHVFEYSPRVGTPAAAFPGQVPSHVKSARGQEMRALAETLKQQFLKKQIGKTVSVLFETKTNDPVETWQGHTENYCLVKVQGTNLANMIHNVQITSLADKELIGVITKT